LKERKIGATEPRRKGRKDFKRVGVPGRRSLKYQGKGFLVKNVKNAPGIEVRRFQEGLLKIGGGFEEKRGGKILRGLKRKGGGKNSHKTGDFLKREKGGGKIEGGTTKRIVGEAISLGGKKGVQEGKATRGLPKGGDKLRIRKILEGGRVKKVLRKAGIEKG